MVCHNCRIDCGRHGSDEAGLKLPTSSWFIVYLGYASVSDPGVGDHGAGRGFGRSQRCCPSASAVTTPSKPGTSASA